jgi:hypothetical protein
MTAKAEVWHRVSIAIRNRFLLADGDGLRNLHSNKRANLSDYLEWPRPRARSNWLKSCLRTGNCSQTGRLSRTYPCCACYI